jgi:hypothetical protein
MSQTVIDIELSIKAALTLDDAGEPQSIKVTGTGNIPRGGCRAIAAEALEAHFGSVEHDYRVHMSPIEEGDEETVFEVYSYQYKR